MKSPFTVLSEKIVYKNFFQVKEEVVEKGSSSRRSYSSIILPSDAAIILAEESQGRFILNREYRHPTGKVLLGCPGGLFEHGEDPEASAKRELLEETGYAVSEARLLGSAYPFPGICSQKIYYFHAKNAVKKQIPTPDPLESIEVLLMTFDEIKHAMQRSDNIDSILCSALWFYSLTFLSKQASL